MAYNQLLAQRVRTRLSKVQGKVVTEKKMFGGLAFLLEGKMCINVSGEKLMCRFDPKLEPEVRQKKGFQTLTMRRKVYHGYAYIDRSGFQKDSDFEYWINLCLRFNDQAKSSKKS